MKNDTTDTCVPCVRGRSVLGGPRGEASFSLSLLAVGVGIIAFGIMDEATAQVSFEATTQYNTEGQNEAVDAIMTYLEGAFGALIMAAAAIGAIVSAVVAIFARSKKLLLVALGFSVIAVGSFIVRSSINGDICGCRECDGYSDVLEIQTPSPGCGLSSSSPSAGCAWGSPGETQSR